MDILGVAGNIPCVFVFRPTRQLLCCCYDLFCFLLFLRIVKPIAVFVILG